ncbi:hypothetical protein TNIN_336211 [Trichonephila inaurata madagascariensis]|uniref:Uncharacterized protein n=1 Tax=Trichonephila inaurata madagascariensis TaxID=2747483 RepID=A0A8X6Y132_9ARAC|nr:hypothetical protein TNIN_336211 [Trichonephila inaurata madagascariensis]
MDQQVTVLFTDEYFPRTEESVSNMAEIMEIKAWINRRLFSSQMNISYREMEPNLPATKKFWDCIFPTGKFDISDCIRLHGASDKLFHLRSRGRSHSIDASQKKKEDPGTAILLVPHQGQCLGTRGVV